ncbi:MAG: phosphoribosylanthranilate isomerase [Pirellulales bacterium]
MFHIKICGVTNVDDARLVASSGADAIGLNFYPQSPRCIQRREAERIVEVLPSDVVKVGVFVNASRDEVCRTFDNLGLDLVQLHGDEPPEYLAELEGRPVMRAFRCRQTGLAPVHAYLDRCRELGCLPHMILVDSYKEGAFGGTGETADWSELASYAASAGPSDRPPLVLAGGLTPDNVERAIRTVHPRAVDTASGVESSPGRKDPNRVRAFVQAAKKGAGVGDQGSGS